MTKRPCLQCGRLTDKTRCPPCTQQHAQQRPTRQQRGYDKQHDNARRALIKQLPVQCAGCTKLLQTSGEMVAAHVQDGMPQYGWVATCRSCNERMKRRRNQQGAAGGW